MQELWKQRHSQVTDAKHVEPQNKQFHLKARHLDLYATVET